MAPRLAVNNEKLPEEGHNSLGMDQDKYTYLKNTIITAEADFEEANGVAKAKKKLVNKARKTFEANGGSLFEFDLVRELSEMQDPDKARARLARLAMYMEFEGISLPKNNLEADPYAKLPAGVREQEIWFERGKIAAKSGKGVFANQFPENCPPDMQQHWARGVMAGQEDIAARMKRAGPLFDIADAPIGDGLDNDDDGDFEDDITDRDNASDDEETAPEVNDVVKPIDWQESPGEHLAQAEIDRMAADRQDDI